MLSRHISCTFILSLIYQENRIYDKIVFCILIDQKYRRIFSTSHTCAEYRPHRYIEQAFALSLPLSLSLSSLLLKSNHASQTWIFSHILVERIKNIHEETDALKSLLIHIHIFHVSQQCAYHCVMTRNAVCLHVGEPIITTNRHLDKFAQNS